MFSDKSKIKIEKESPYLNGRMEWLERYGTYIKQKRNWQLIAFLSLIITAMSIVMNIVQTSQQKVIPYIVEVDKLGRFSVVARADEASTAPERLVQSVISSIIGDWRTVTADIELQRKMINRLSYFFAGSATGVLKEWYSNNNPYEVAKSGKLVHVEIKSLPLPLSQNSYRIEWVEKVISHSGVTLDNQRFEATVTIQISQPMNEATLLHNPGGIYITHIAASKVLMEADK